MVEAVVVGAVNRVGVGFADVIALFHDLSGKRVVIVGGGDVALRKARRFAREAQVTVASPTFREGFADLSCELIRESVTEDTAGARFEGAFLVVPATDDATLNARLAAIARRAGCLVNRVDRAAIGDDGLGGEGSDATGAGHERSDERDAGAGIGGEEPGDVIVPSTIHTEEVTVAIATGGSSPAVSRYLRQQLEPVLEGIDPMVRLQRDLRAQLKRTIDASDDRRERLRSVLEDEEIRRALAADEQQGRALARERVGLPPDRDR